MCAPEEIFVCSIPALASVQFVAVNELVDRRSLASGIPALLTSPGAQWPDRRR